jgi:hypothetical protein
MVMGAINQDIDLLCHPNGGLRLLVHDPAMLPHLESGKG